MVCVILRFNEALGLPSRFGQVLESSARANVTSSAAVGEGEKKSDVLLVGPPTGDGEGFKVLRRREETLEVGELRNVKEGKPIHGDLVKLTPREGEERLFDVDVIVPKKALAADTQRKGPAQVATDTYRDNWDQIFAARKAKPELPN
jgi:hypothetical protein